MERVFVLLAFFAFNLALPCVNGNKNRIVNGDELTDIRDAPWIASLRESLTGNPGPNTHICGSVILNENWVISSAHCCRMGISELFFVVAGSATLTQGSDAQVRGINQTLLHPGFDPLTLDNDVCLLELKESLTFSDTIKPIQLAALVPEEEKPVTLFGWGKTKESDFLLPDQLQMSVNVQIYSQSVCKSIYESSQYKVTDNMFCTYGTRGIFGDQIVDACEGDSGGPVVYSNGGVEELVGIISWGNGCGRFLQPGVNVNIALYKEWINSIIQ